LLVFGEVGPEFHDVATQPSLVVGELVSAAVDRHLVGELTAERGAEDVVEFDRVIAVAGRREVVLVNVGAVPGDQARHFVGRRDHMHVREHLQNGANT